MKRELTMEELEQVAGGDLGSYFKAIGAGISTGWRVFFLSELRKERLREEEPIIDRD